MADKICEGAYILGGNPQAGPVPEPTDGRVIIIDTERGRVKLEPSTPEEKIPTFVRGSGQHKP